MGNYFVISIGRQYGCGGREIGKMLAEKLNIGFYDKDILRISADKSGIRESYFYLADERAGGTLLSKIVSGLVREKKNPLNETDILKPDNLFKYQSQVIRELASKESFVIIGRCADEILKESDNLVKIYLYANIEHRAQHVINDGIFKSEEVYNGIKTLDKERADYYRYYTGRERGIINNYDLSIDTSKISIDSVSDIIENYVKKRGFIPTTTS